MFGLPAPLPTSPFCCLQRLVLLGFRMGDYHPVHHEVETREKCVCCCCWWFLKQRDRPFWAVCHFLVLSGFRVVIWIYAWERIRSARDVLPSSSETTRGAIYYMTTSASTRFVVSTVGLISMSLSFRKFLEISTMISLSALGKVEFSTKNLVQSFEVLELPHDLGTIRFPSGHFNFHLRKNKIRKGCTP